MHLAFDGDDNCAGIIGYDRLRFQNRGQEMTIGMATNFYTLKTGIGGFLWLYVMKSCPIGLVFGGSEDTHRLIKRQKFSYYSGVNIYALNARYSAYEGDPGWKATLKPILRAATKKRLRDCQTAQFERESTSIEVREILSSEAELIESDRFSFRFAPSAEYLRWRYRSLLPFVRYRWFNIFQHGTRVGYCVLNDSPEQIIVAHSDGTDPETLALGTLKAIFLAAANDTGTRTARLASSHPAMQQVFTRHGFVLDVADRPMAVGSLQSTIELPPPENWLVSFGIGDNDLRTSTFLPLQEEIAELAPAAVES